MTNEELIGGVLLLALVILVVWLLYRRRNIF